MAMMPGDATVATLSPFGPGLTYDLRIRALNPSGSASAWQSLTNKIAAGDTTAPASPSSITVLGIFAGVRLRWANPSDTDFAFVEVYEGTAATPVPTSSSTPYARINGTEFIRQGLTVGVTRWYWLRSVDTSGNRSAWAGGVNATAAAVDTGQLTGQITDTQITDGAISTPKLAANSITSDKVGANQIITTSANIANAVIKSANIGNLEVDTVNIKNQAVTIPIGAYSSSAQTVNTTTWTTIQAATFPETNTTLNINFGFFPKVLLAFSAYYYQLQILRGGTQIFLIDLPKVVYPTYSGSNLEFWDDYLPFNYGIIDVTTSANQLYEVQVRKYKTAGDNGTVVSANFAHRTLTLIGLRK
jgi:hypothetical protein